MLYVYVLETAQHPRKLYVGMTADLRARLRDHNAGRSPYTAKFRPWCLRIYIAFSSETAARSFERYLKSGSGKTFLRRHFIPPSL